MGRRRFYRPPDTRSSLGDGHIEDAVSALNRTAMTTVNLMTKYEHSREQTLPMLFRDDDLAKLQAVRGMVEARRDQIPYVIGEAANLWIDYDGAAVPTIQPERLHIQPERAGPLLDHIAAVRSIHLQFEAVKYVLRWLNREATPGAIRYYWPTAMQLCPKATCWAELQDVPSRYKEPEGIRPRMQMMQDAAACVVSSLMLPNNAQPKPRSQSKMWLTFNSYQPTRGEFSWTTDVMTYNI